ncbi:hypothetical protein [Cellulomonas sp. Y8]|uniref:hypothetical protein n=1 Tax=Cellulomonas sp. Y8 TaxID=2591145 RepID=UPI0011C789DF|nr:hypothetical protein [Cellulomonas sp. Y8]
MNEHDLNAALGDLARRGADDQAARMRDGDGLSAGRVASVAGRRRRRRTTVASAATLAVVGAAVVAGAALGSAPEPQPAAPRPTATSTPTPASTSPAPAPTATSGDAGTLPAGDPTLPFGACGALADAVPDVPFDDRWSIATTLASPEAAVGGGLQLTTRIDVDIPQDWSPIGVGTGIWPGSGPELLVLRDGVVVGTGDLYGDVPAGLEGYDVAASAHSAVYQGLLPLVSCTDGRPLPAGQYALVPTSLVLPLGDDPATAERVRTEGADAVAAQHPDAWRRVVGASLDVVVVDGRPGRLPDPVESDDRAIVPEPSCGAPLVPSAGRMLTVDVLAPGTVRSGVTGSSAGALTYAGPGRLRAAAQTSPAYWVLQDGLVVGGPPAMTDGDHAVVDVDRSAPLAIAGPMDLRACDAWGTPGDAPLPAGEYTVVPAVQVTGGEVRTAEGARELAWGVVTGKPFTLVVE